MSTKKQTANRHDTAATQKASTQFDTKMPNSRFQNHSSPVFQGSGFKCKSAMFGARDPGPPDLSSFRSAIFDAQTRVRSACLSFKSVVFDVDMGFPSSSLALNSAIFDANLRFRHHFGAHLTFKSAIFEGKCDFGAHPFLSNRHFLKNVKM